MRFSIGHRLFAAVLLAILAVTATGIWLLRQNVLGSFADYAVNIELDRLTELSADLAGRYRQHGSWAFVPADATLRRNWIATELVRLQEARLAREAQPGGAAAAAAGTLGPGAPATGATPAAPAVPHGAAPLPPPPPAPHAADALPAAPAAPARPALPALPPLPAPAVPLPPPAPPMPAAPAAPATPATPATRGIPPVAAALRPVAEAALDLIAAPAHAAPADPPVQQAASGPSASAAPALGSAPLYDRITLLDAQHRYLAGAPPGAAPAVERALTVDGHPIGYLTVTRPLRPDDAPALAFLGQLTQSLLAIVGASIVLSALAASVLAAHFRRPIRQLAGGARALEQGQFETRLPTARSDELGALAASFNRLAARLQTVEQSRRQWVADTSHELRTPLAVLRAQLEAVQDGVRPADPATLAAMLRQVLALNRLIDELYTLARADVGELDLRRCPVDLWQLAQEEAAAFAPRLQAAGLRCELAAAGPLPLSGDPDRLRQVLRNLLENSLRYTARGGTVRLSGGADPARARLQLHLDDSAPGVPAEALARLAERFYRVDRSRSRQDGGAGLGLALCERLVTAHGGRLLFAHSPLGGLRVTLDLPCST